MSLLAKSDTQEKSRSGKLKAYTVKRTDIISSDIDRMYEVFGLYYDNTTNEKFKKDLKNKEVIFLLCDSSSDEIMGFSTIYALETRINGKSIRGLFSGDTIIDEKYWGQGVLGVAFLKYLFIQKLKNPFRPVYWFLISKGYKTYLLMANNFPEHYPRYEKETPRNKKRIIDSFAKEMYKDYYDSNTGVIFFQKKGQCKDQLKCEVTPISLEMMQKNSRIRFFAEKNPGWKNGGDELACIAKMTFSMPLFYQLKVWRKQCHAIVLGLRSQKRQTMNWLVERKILK
jgi:hypothetical protein